jgi:trans-aconitate 2-methyltransferase
MKTDAWDPKQYQRFATERAQPFHDLLALVEPVPGGSVVDLGCGTGELTALLHAHVGAASTLGLDNSDAMLEEARALDAPGVRFEHADIGKLDAGTTYDVVFSNAALQWLPDHPTLLAHVADLVAPRGQLAVQVPSNFDHPGHVLAMEVAAEEPFLAALGNAVPADPVRSVLAPERYAELLHDLGFAEQHVRLQVYGHVLESSAAVVEWTKGTNLTRFRRLLSDELYEKFLERYTERVVATLGDSRPYFYPFKRVLFRARKA